VQFPAPWGEGWLKASGLGSVVNTPQLAAGCFNGVFFGELGDLEVRILSLTDCQAGFYNPAMNSIVILSSQ
jgi:hypothetical protein